MLVQCFSNSDTSAPHRIAVSSCADSASHEGSPQPVFCRASLGVGLSEHLDQFHVHGATSVRCREPCRGRGSPSPSKAAALPSYEWRAELKTNSGTSSVRCLARSRYGGSFQLQRRDRLPSRDRSLQARADSDLHIPRPRVGYVIARNCP